MIDKQMVIIHGPFVLADKAALQAGQKNAVLSLDHEIAA